MSRSKRLRFRGFVKLFYWQIPFLAMYAKYTCNTSNDMYLLSETLMLGKIEGKRRRGWQRMRWLDSITNSMDMNLNKLQEIVKNRGAWHVIVHGVAKSRARLSDLTTKTNISTCLLRRAIYPRCHGIKKNKWHFPALRNLLSSWKRKFF